MAARPLRGLLGARQLASQLGFAWRRATQKDGVYTRDLEQIEIVRDMHAEALVRLGLLMAPVPGMPPGQALKRARVEVQDAAVLLARLAGHDVERVVNDIAGLEEQTKYDGVAELAKDAEGKRSAAVVRLQAAFRGLLVRRRLLQEPRRAMVKQHGVQEQSKIVECGPKLNVLANPFVPFDYEEGDESSSLVLRIRSRCGPKSFEWNVSANPFVPVDVIEEGEVSNTLDDNDDKDVQQPVAWDDRGVWRLDEMLACLPRSFVRNVLADPFVPVGLAGDEATSSLDDNAEGDVQQFAGVAGRPPVAWEDRGLAADGDAVRLPEGGLAVILD